MGHACLNSEKPESSTLFHLSGRKCLCPWLLQPSEIAHWGDLHLVLVHVRSLWAVSVWQWSHTWTSSLHECLWYFGQPASTHCCFSNLHSAVEGVQFKDISVSMTTGKPHPVSFSQPPNMLWTEQGCRNGKAGYWNMFWDGAWAEKQETKWIIFVVVDWHMKLTTEKLSCQFPKTELALIIFWFLLYINSCETRTWIKCASYCDFLK